VGSEQKKRGMVEPRSEVTTARGMGRWVARTQGAFGFSPLLHRDDTSIHETGMKSRRLFYLMVIRTVWGVDYDAELASGAER
jgi:hypothetical protein